MKSAAAEAVLAELCVRHALEEGQRCRLASMLKTIAAEARPPTAVRDPELAAEVHLADSLVALEVGQIRDARCLVDLGAGAGFPGLPLAVALPRAEVRLVESQTKKCAFLRRMVAVTGLENVQVIESRIEEFSGGLGVHDAALARALARQPVVLEYAAPLLRRGGMLLDWRGRRDAADEQAAVRSAAELGMQRCEVRAVRPFATARDLHLHVYVKTSDTPARFPRRPGIARKRPLGRLAARREQERARPSEGSPAPSAPADRLPQ